MDDNGYSPSQRSRGETGAWEGGGADLEPVDEGPLVLVAGELAGVAPPDVRPEPVLGERRAQLKERRAQLRERRAQLRERRALLRARQTRSTIATENPCDETAQAARQGARAPFCPAASAPRSSRRLRTAELRTHSSDPSPSPPCRFQSTPRACPRHIGTPPCPAAAPRSRRP